MYLNAFIKIFFNSKTQKIMKKYTIARIICMAVVLWSVAFAILGSRQYLPMYVITGLTAKLLEFIMWVNEE